MRLLTRVLFGRSRTDLGLLLLLALLGAAVAAVINSEDFRRYIRMRQM